MTDGYRWLQIAIVWAVWIGAVAFGGSAITAIMIGVVASIKGVW